MKWINGWMKRTFPTSPVHKNTVSWYYFLDDQHELLEHVQMKQLTLILTAITSLKIQVWVYTPYSLLAVCREAVICPSHHVTKHATSRTLHSYLSSISVQPSAQSSGNEWWPQSTTWTCSTTSFTGFMTSSQIHRHISSVLTSIRATSKAHSGAPSAIFHFTQ